MFYLTEYFRILQKNIVLSAIFIFSIISMVTLGYHMERIEKELEISNKTKSYPYFNALVTQKTNVSAIGRKLKQLPGVISVNHIKSKSIQKEVQKLQKQFGDEILSGVAAINYKNLKIELGRNLELKNQNLIKEYLQRLLGNKAVTISEIKLPKKIKIDNKSSVFTIVKNGHIYAFSIVSGLFLISLFLLMKPIKSHAYILEKFQRKSNVSLKMIMTITVMVSLIAYIINFLLFSQLEVLGLITVFAVISLGVVCEKTHKEKFSL